MLTYSLEPSQGSQDFDPLKEWGEPQHLPLPPSPTPVDAPSASADGSGDSKSADQKNAAAKGASAPKGTKGKPLPKVCYIIC